MCFFATCVSSLVIYLFRFFASLLIVLSRSVMSNSLQSMDYRPSGSSVHKIFQARILEWDAISFSKYELGIQAQGQQFG